jgi:hypothetical protein
LCAGHVVLWPISLCAGHVVLWPISLCGGHVVLWPISLCGGILFCGQSLCVEVFCFVANLLCASHVSFSGILGQIIRFVQKMASGRLQVTQEAIFKNDLKGW